jgi:hypothetical protein
MGPAVYPLYTSLRVSLTSLHVELKALGRGILFKEYQATVPYPPALAYLPMRRGVHAVTALPVVEP